MPMGTTVKASARSIVMVLAIVASSTAALAVGAPAGAATPLQVVSNLQAPYPLYAGVRGSGWVSVSNLEATALDDVVTEVVLPPELAFDSAPASSPCALEAPSTVVCRWGSLGPTPTYPPQSGRTVPITLVAKRGGSNLPVTTRTTSAQGVGLTRTTSITILDQTDLEVTSFGDGRTGLHPGESSTYTVGFRNASPYPMSGVSVSVPLPAGVVAEWAEVSTNSLLNPCSWTTTLLICRPRTLQPGEAATMRFSVVAPASGSLSLTATIDARGPDIDPGDDQATDVDLIGTTQHDLVAVLTDVDPTNLPAQGDRRWMRARIENRGPDSADVSKAVLKLPAGARLVQVDQPSHCTMGTRLLTCGFGRLSPGASGEVNALVALDQQGPLKLRLTASAGSGTELVPTDDEASRTLAVAAPSVDLGLRFGARDADPLVVGEELTLDLYPRNLGPSDGGAVVEVTLPPALEHVSTTFGEMPAGTCDPVGADRVLRCTVPDVGERHDPYGYVGYLSVRLRALELATTSVSARISPPVGGPADPVPGNDAATTGTLTIVPVTADVRPWALTLTGGTARTPSFIATFEDRGPATAAGVTMTMTVSAGLRITGFETSWRGQQLPGCTMTERQVRCTKDELLERDPVLLSIRTEAVGTGASSETVTAHITTTTPDPVRNDRRTLTVSVPAL